MTRLRLSSRPWSPCVAAALVLTGCSFDVYKLPLPGGPDVGSDPITVTAQFRDVLDLVPDSTVKVNDVTVGKITDISLQGYTRPGHHAAAQRHRAARQRRRDDPADQPAR